MSPVPEFGVERNRDCRVLVVEDEPRLREVLVRAIPDMGFEAAGVRSAEEAIKTLESQPYHIVVLDLNLPGMHGLEFLQLVRQRWTKTAVVILKGYGDLEAARKAIHLDAVDFLTKPCPLGDLEVALDRARRRIQPEAVSVDPMLQAQIEMRRAGVAAAQAKGDRPVTEEAKAQKLDDLEKEHILAALERNNGNRTRAARELGISLRTLYYRLSEYQKTGG